MKSSKNFLFQILSILASFLAIFAVIGANEAHSPPDGGESKTFPDDVINIITYKNNKALEKDFIILEKELNKLGYKVNYVNIYVLYPPPLAHINLFLETGNEYFLPYAKKNYIIPNPDWFINGAETIQKFDLILCKTREAEKIFNQWSSKVKFISFTSNDLFDPKQIKSYKYPLHNANASSQQSTTIIENIWFKNPGYPILTIMKNELSLQSMRHNVHLINGYIVPEHVKILINTCGVHLFPTETEGFGHSIFESMSAEAVVVSTDAPPMNEFIKDPRCLAGYNGTGTQYLATTYSVDPDKLEMVIGTLMRMPEEELRKIGQKNRRFFLENDAFFKKQIADIFKKN